MGSFDPESLSPRPIEAEQVDLPFGLTWPDLAPALPGRTGEPSLTRRYELQGLYDQTASTPVTVHHPAAGGIETVDLFVKRTTASEARWYRLLTARGVPLPQLHAQVERDGAVVIVLEFLPTIGVQFEAAHDVADLLQLIARLNAVVLEAPVPDAPQGIADATFTEMVQEALNELARMASFADLGIEPGTWLGAYLQTKDRCAELPTALTHGELSFQQVGRRSDGTLVVFDLATVAVRPRFFDIAGILTTLAERTGVAERALLADHLRALEANGAEAPQIDDALTELRVVRANRAFESLPWLVRSHADPEIGFELLHQQVTALDDDLRDLGFV